MSEQRNSSAVRNLRSIFETKGSDSSPDTRGRSRSGLTDKDNNSRPTSRVRASFVSVDPSGGMAAEITENGTPSLKRESSAGLRRGSFSENDENGEALLGLKKTVSQEAERRERDSDIAEAIPEHAAVSAAGTPTLRPMSKQADEPMEGSPMAQKADREPANPNKPITAAEEEPAELQPAEPTSEAAVSGGEALPPVAEDLRDENKTRAGTDTASAPGGPNGEEAPASKELHSALKAAKSGKKPDSKSTTNGKPASIATKTADKPPASSVKSPKTPSFAKPTESAKTNPSPAAASKQPTKKASRSSLTAPTAASVARAAGADRSVSTSSKQSPPSKASKPRETTKPVDLSSRLTAPTAASRARHDPASTTAPGPALNGRASTSTRPKPQTSSTRPTPRSSLQPSQRPESRSSHVSKKTTAPADGSFLERMMRPTAASSSKVHDKPGQAPVSSKPKTNGHAKKPAGTAKAASRPGTSGTEKSAHSQKSASAEAPVTDASTVEPDHQNCDSDLAVATHDSEDQQDARPETEETTKEAFSGPEAPSQPDQKAIDPPESTLAAIGIPTGNSTPIPRTNGQTDGALEATPAFAGEETIR